MLKLFYFLHVPTPCRMQHKISIRQGFDWSSMNPNTRSGLNRNQNPAVVCIHTRPMFDRHFVHLSLEALTSVSVNRQTREDAAIGASVRRLPSYIKPGSWYPIVLRTGATTGEWPTQGGGD